ncbi:hypothetical protein B0H13DRAFT_2300823 [Mycena leptocephala]|nr:hypothetical protein B0H13DRAFT_2300823 [Mycena leptocephala]
MASEAPIERKSPNREAEITPRAPIIDGCRFSERWCDIQDFVYVRTIVFTKGWARVRVNPAGFRVGSPGYGSRVVELADPEEPATQPAGWRVVAGWEMAGTSWILESTLPEQKPDAMRLVLTPVSTHLACHPN